jgi:peroxiredoxin
VTWTGLEERGHYGGMGGAIPAEMSNLTKTVRTLTNRLVCARRRTRLTLMSAKLSRGAIVSVCHLEAIEGQSVTVPTPAGRTHLQFRRFAGCPICHLHLRSFAERYNEVADAGITEVVFFHYPVRELRGYQSRLPFMVVADPHKEHYRQLGVEARLRSLMHPRAMQAAFRGYVDVMRHRNDPNSAGVGAGDGSTHLGLPADFLIDPDGTVVALHDGRHADHQWSVDELLEIDRSIPRKESS